MGAFAMREAKRSRKAVKIRAVHDDDDDEPVTKKKKKSSKGAGKASGKPKSSFTEEITSTALKSVKKYRYGPEMTYEERKAKNEFKKKKPSKSNSFKSKSRYKRR